MLDRLLVQLSQIAVIVIAIFIIFAYFNGWGT
jgi:hypothetical protein